LEWLDNSANEKRFEIQRSADGGVTFTPLADVGANLRQYTDQGLAAEKSFTYRVRAVNDGGASLFSNNATGKTLPAPPGVPTRLSITEPTASSLKISWRDEGGKATGFDLQRKTGEGNFVSVAAPGAEVRQLVDRGLSPNTAYKYRIRAKNEGGFSAFTDEASGLTLPAAPKELTATATGPRKIDLKWRAGSTSGGYAIERHSQEEESFRRIATVGGGTTAYSDQNLPAGAKMTYRVRAFNDAGESDASNEASASTEVALVGLSLNPPEVRGGRKAHGRITLSGPAPAGGFVVTLASAKPRKASVPKSFTVKAGSTAAEFTIETNDVRKTTIVTISAEAKGVKKEALLTVKG
jgi:fibronectin type 3 domain-containing protein